MECISIPKGFIELNQRSSIYIDCVDFDGRFAKTGGIFKQFARDLVGCQSHAVGIANSDLVESSPVDGFPLCERKELFVGKTIKEKLLYKTLVEVPSKESLKSEKTTLA